MIRKINFIVLAFLLFMTVRVEAGMLTFSVTLTPNVPDLSALQPGDLVDFTVGFAETSGTGFPLNFLAVTVEWDVSILGEPLADPVPGIIVPDPTGFVATPPIPGLGLADAFYDSSLAVSGDPIIASSPFYDFSIQVQGVGSGSIAITSVIFSGTDANGMSVDSFIPDPDPLADPNLLAFDLSVAEPLRFTSTQIIPEPSSLVLGAIGAVGLLGVRRLRRVCGG